MPNSRITAMMRPVLSATASRHTNTANAARKNSTLIVSERLETYATDSVCTGCSRNSAPAKTAKASRIHPVWPAQPSRRRTITPAKNSIDRMKHNTDRVIRKRSQTPNLVIQPVRNHQQWPYPEPAPKRTIRDIRHQKRKIAIVEKELTIQRGRVHFESDEQHGRRS